MESKKRKKPIYVTRPAMPPLEEFTEYLKKIWENRTITNNGPFHQQFEKELAEYLGVKYISLFANGTLALMTALQTLRITGEVITTPFSFVATTHALWWNNIKPVFADIEPDYFGLDPEKVESAITAQTTAILPVHIYGYPCQVDRLQEIADTHNLKLIYDAAHAFGVKIKENSILNYGDLSVLSFHATKAFNTIEGGAIVCHDKKIKNRIDFLKNFGFVDETIIIEPGINAKMNEVQAAYGLLQLKYIDEYITKRKAVAEIYREKLYGIKGIHYLNDLDGVHHNYPYFPILIDAREYGKTRDYVYEELKKHNIFSRRYFYPLISQLPMYKKLLSAATKNLPIAERVAKEVLCLPLYHDLSKKEVTEICGHIQKH
ncbi:MAG: aminotransferase [Candidatus Kerfeldbacteria bacterium CG_4_10_14_0_8_um_filter_42_10]|uniref:Aminotransferase n=1 Tax=Candidatus Kerfeldbacteria bacterium CG_4_10_14_0_8_um_filter_42_10 TaxID=2014248 RepID=A0A2M7RLR2_9BACT|nr:MAG: aminotransferase [Candidatus Kerfeldbacteria bacterium CG_4_10_14_0_8_um_filter_42_10]